MAYSVQQNYPQIESNECHACLDDSTLVPHTTKISLERFKDLVEQAMKAANIKSGRKLLDIPDDATDNDLGLLYNQAAKKLFDYFKKYPVDPAATAQQLIGRSYRDVGIELFRASTQQKARMNSGWRYQYLAVSAAQESQRFTSVSDIGAAEADFNAVIAFQDKAITPLSLYVSVKNRRNTMGGQDWPKAIHALETVARNDKNRQGAYCCISGIAMDKGHRYIKIEQKSGQPHSINTEVWLSDYFWSFFTNYSYEEIMTAVLDVLMEAYDADELPTELAIPDEILEGFGQHCHEKDLVDESGLFNNPYQLVKFFVGTL
jgi:hypothetical protein